MALPKPPPAVDIPPDAKRAILAGFRKLVEVFQSKGLIDAEPSHADILHDPAALAEFIRVFRAHPKLCEDVVVGFDGRPVTDPDKPLVCEVSLAQIQQLMVKTCARHLFVQDQGEEKTVTRTVTTKRFLIFKGKTQVTHRVANKDPRALKAILAYIAFDWQLPLLAEYAELSLQQMVELGENLLALRTPEAIREMAKFDYETIRKARTQLGAEFPVILEIRPAAIKGALYWPKDMYQFFRSFMGLKFFDFMARDEQIFMMVATMDKALIRVYGEVLAYIAKENLMEMQRLNIDRVDILMTTFKSVFGPRMAQLLVLPNFAKDLLRRQVDSLIHMRQDKAHMQEAQLVTWGALAPQVNEWLARQPRSS